MINTKIWTIYALITTFLLVIIIFFLMMWSDTYSNIHTKRTQFYSVPNTNVMKVDYILKNNKKYDSFIFGSSRVSYINPFLITNGKYYNMTYSEGIPHEHLINIQLFINSGIKIKNLLIGLDEFSYQVSFKQHQIQPLTKAHYLATNTSYNQYIKDLYLRFPLSEDRKHIKKSLLGSHQFTIKIEDQKYTYQQMEKIFSKETLLTKEHLDNPKFNKPTLYHGDVLQETIIDIKKIKDLCLSNDINCTFFINPIHNKTYEFVDLNLLNKFRYNLSTITDYYDFSFPNNISKNNQYWIETSHYTLEVGNMMIDKMYKNKNYFGIYINKELSLNAI